tara:strand:- start:4901 stop:5527 length:627 start_codon:yes stop_codon:yes gene_type:complete
MYHLFGNTLPNLNKSRESLESHESYMTQISERRNNVECKIVVEKWKEREMQRKKGQNRLSLLKISTKFSLPNDIECQIRRYLESKYDDKKWLIQSDLANIRKLRNVHSHIHLYTKIKAYNRIPRLEKDLFILTMLNLKNPHFRTYLWLSNTNLDNLSYDFFENHFSYHFINHSISQNNSFTSDLSSLIITLDQYHHYYNYDVDFTEFY